MEKQKVEGPLISKEDMAKVSSFIEGKTVMEWTEEYMVFADGSRVNIDKDCMYGNTYELITN